MATLAYYRKPVNNIPTPKLEYVNTETRVSLNSLSLPQGWKRGGGGGARNLMAGLYSSDRRRTRCSRSPEGSPGVL